MKKLSILALMISATVAITPAFAETTTHYNTVSPQADLSFAFDDSQNLQAVAMTEQEMTETEGAVAPLYAVGVFAINTGRFIATRYVSRQIAANAAKNGCNVMCYGTS